MMVFSQKNGIFADDYTINEMAERFEFTIEERELVLNLYTELKEKVAPSLEEDDEGRSAMSLD